MTFQGVIRSFFLTSNSITTFSSIQLLIKAEMNLQEEDIYMSELFPLKVCPYKIKICQDKLQVP